MGPSKYEIGFLTTTLQDLNMFLLDCNQHFTVSLFIADCDISLVHKSFGDQSIIAFILLLLFMIWVFIPCILASKHYGSSEMKSVLLM